MNLNRGTLLASTCPNCTARDRGTLSRSSKGIWAHFPYRLCTAREYGHTPHIDYGSTTLVCAIVKINQQRALTALDIQSLGTRKKHKCPRELHKGYLSEHIKDSLLCTIPCAKLSWPCKLLSSLNRIENKLSRAKHIVSVFAFPSHLTIES